MCHSKPALMFSFSLKCGIFQFQNGSETQATANRENNQVTAHLNIIGSKICDIN